MATIGEQRLEVAPGWVLPPLDGLAMTSALPSQWVRTSLDTAEGDLARWGAALVHTGGGGTGRWTLDAPGLAAAKSWDGRADEVPPGAAALLVGLAGGRPLDRRQITVGTRRTHTFVDADGAAVAVVDDDVVDGPASRTRVLTVDGPAARRVARRLCRHGARHGEIPAAAGPPVPHRPHRRDPAGALVAAALGRGLAELMAADPPLRDGATVEAVHAARVATRRLRSDLTTYRDLVDPEWGEQLRSGLRWLGACLGEVRDLDVLRQRLAGRRHADPVVSPGLDGLLELLDWQRRAALASLDEALSSHRYATLVGEISAGAVTPRLRGLGSPDELEPARATLPRAARRAPAAGPDEPAGKVLPVLVGAAWRRVRRSAASSGGVPTDEQLHTIRIRAKQLRYAAEAASAVLGSDMAAVAAAAKAVQTVLGDLHDAVVAEAWLRDHGVRGDAGVAFSAGVLAATERALQTELRDAWRADWARLERRARRLTRR